MPQIPDLTNHEATEELSIVGSSFVHLTSPTSSLILVFDGATAQLPQIAYWGEGLSGPVDLAALHACGRLATPHSAPDMPRRRPILPMPVDGWRLRPALSGARADGTSFSPLLRLTGASIDDAEHPSSVNLTCSDDDAGIVVRMVLSLTPSGVITIDQSLTNTGTSEYLLGQLAATLPVPPRAVEVLDLAGRWCRERSPQRTTLGMGTWSREGRRGRTGHDSPLLLAAGTPGFGFADGDVWAIHLGWSGDSAVWAERGPEGFGQLGVAELLSVGEVRLAPGASYAAPTAYAAYGHGLDAVSAAFHRYVRARSQHPRGPRPVVLNTWEAVYFEHDLVRLTALADAASKAGVERFVLDDGWFGSRRDDTSGLGDWIVSDDVWPDGLAPLIEAVRSRGMDFGLWVEPEMVNPDSDLYRAHPDWILQVPGRLPTTWRNQQVLDLANPKAWAHLLERLDALLTELDIAFLKWDHNRDLVDAGHLGTPGTHVQTLAVYALLDELRRRHPGVEIESCASGGGRVDLGILQRTDRIWASDTIDAHERQHIQRWTASLVPLELIGAHVGSATAHTTGRQLHLPFRLTTALFGHFGIEADLTKLTDQEQAAVKASVDVYKQWRDVLHTGTLVRLDDTDPGALAFGVVAEDGSRALFSYAQLESSAWEVLPALRLRGLDATASYRIEPLTLGREPGAQQFEGPTWVGESAVVSGSLLMSAGLVLPVLHPDSAQLIAVHRL